MMIYYYKSAFTYIQPSEPSLLCPSIKKTSDWIKEELNNKSMLYTVLVYLTDGNFDDFGNALEEMSKCSTLPISFIFLIVGNKGRGSFANIGNQAAQENYFVIEHETYKTSPVEFVNLIMQNVQKQTITFFKARDYSAGLGKSLNISPRLN